MTVRFSSTQERLFIVLASCTTSVLCKSFQRTLSFYSLPVSLFNLSFCLRFRSLDTNPRHDITEASFVLFIWLIGLLLESGCKGIAFSNTNQIFSQKSCLKTHLFNICLQLVRIKLLIYLIKYTHAGAWVCACTYTQITCMAGDAVHGTRILSF